MAPASRLAPTRRVRRRVRRARLWGLLLVTVALAATMAPVSASAVSEDGAPPLEPIDAQNWVNQYDTTWDDFVRVPGTDWSNPAIEPTVRKWRAALVLVDYPNKTFEVSQPERSTIFGNPIGVSNIPREDVPEFYRNFVNTPSELNHGMTLNAYWMENSQGRYGVDVANAYGPYRLTRNHFEYGIAPYGNSSNCPPTYTCNGNFTNNVRAAWVADVGTTVANSFDFVFYVSAGLDESTGWQQFGEMLWENPEDVPDAFGPPPEFDPDNVMTNWMPTRYKPWTSWAIGSSMWASAGGGVGTMFESSGQAGYAHEFSHLIGIGDNYNPVTPVQRSATGPWDLQSRGSWNGPGGVHDRWQVPPSGGSTVPPHSNLRNKLHLGLLSTAEVLQLNRNGLASSGLAVAEVRARAAGPTDDLLAGVRVALDGPAPVDKNPSCHPNTAGPTCSGNANYTNYTMETVQRIGADSFVPGSGVLIQKNKNGNGSSCGHFTCFAWVIDANPEFMEMVNYYLPDGTPVMIDWADYRQLNDATFNAGTNSGSTYEFVDEYNRLHFYVIDVEHDADGVRTYTLGVRSLDGAGPHTRGVAVEQGHAAPHTASWSAQCHFPLHNTGEQAPTDPALHPADANEYLDHDLYRLSSEVAEGEGWTAELYNELAAAPFGGTVDVPVYVTREAGSDPTAVVALTAVSESDPTQTATATCALSEADTLAPMAAKELVAAALAGLGSTGDGPLDVLVHRAADRVAQSVDPVQWVDDTALDPDRGGEVFDRERRAVLDLQQVLAALRRSGDPAGLSVPITAAIDDLVRIDRRLAVAVDAAAHPDAASLLAQGDAAAASGLPVTAIEAYRAAWQLATAP